MALRTVADVRDVRVVNGTPSVLCLLAQRLHCGTEATPKALPVESTNGLEREATETALAIAERFSWRCALWPMSA